jgi:holo-[acyl-carrier protein] synthase
MIIGIGLDIVELARVARWLSEEAEAARRGERAAADLPGRDGSARASTRAERFAGRVLTDEERKIWAALAPGRKAEFLAGRFAVKEAVAKALGCGIGGVVGFRDIEVLPDERGRPVCRLSAGAWERLGLEEARHAVHVAISHESSVVAATAMVERR